MQCLLLLFYCSTALGSHFRGGIIMVRPAPNGEQNEVRACTESKRRLLSAAYAHQAECYYTIFTLYLT